MHGPMNVKLASFCEHGNEHWASVKCNEFRITLKPVGFTRMTQLRGVHL